MPLAQVGSCPALLGLILQDCGILVGRGVVIWRLLLDFRESASAAFSG